jgi:TonB family protein
MLKYFFCLLISFFSFLFAEGQRAPDHFSKRNGTLKVPYYDAEKSYAEGQIHKHYKTGLWKTYNAKGEVILEENYLNGMLNGLCVEYYSIGIIKSRGDYSNGNKTGEWEYFNSERIRTAVKNYDSNGNEMGVQETFYSSGNINTYSIIDSLKNKKVYTYDSFGKLNSIEHFSENKLQGLQYYYYEWGRSISASDTFPSVVKNYENGELNGSSDYYNGGRLIKEENYKDGTWNGCSKGWNTNGTLRDSLFYTDGKLNGNSYHFDLGKLTSCENYKMGELLSTSNYDSGGKINSIYYTGEINDSLVQFYPSGIIKNYGLLNKKNDSKKYFAFSENKVRVLSFTCEENKPATNVEVYSDSGDPLKSGTTGYKNQLKKYLPGIFHVDEKTGAILENKCFADNTDDPPPGIIEPSNLHMVDIDPDPWPDPENETMPSFPGDKDAFLRYINTNLKYPVAEKKAGKQGTVYVQFTIEKDGSISDVTARKEVKDAPGFTKEAIRLISEMPKWNPGQMNGRTVRVSVIQPVKFVLQ